MRKNVVYIFVGEYPSDYFLNYLANKLPNTNKRVIKTQRCIKINGYNIVVMKKPNLTLKGCRPEIIYYVGNVIGYNDDNVRTEGDTKILSNRKEPIRYIKEELEIDLREFIDDEYALLKCRFKRLKLKDKFKYVWLTIRNKIRRED